MFLDHGWSGGDSTVSLRIDTVALAGQSTTLVVGNMITLSIPESGVQMLEGARVVGVANKACEDATEDCDAAAQERVRVVEVAGSTGSILCHGTALTATPDALARIMAGPDCSSDIKRLLREAGADTGCCDPGPCMARPGPIPSSGWAGLFGIAALTGRRLLRRRSVVAS